MARLSLTRETLNALFAKSGNVCAFPGCNEEIVTSRNQFVGQICHIEAANPGGPRYNPNSTDEERRSIDNLMLFCYRHHKETDDATAFGVDSLKAMKREHEALHGQKPFKVNEAFLHRLNWEMEGYWTALLDANRNGHVVPDLAVSVRVGTPASEQFADLYKSLARLDELHQHLLRTDESLNDEVRDHLASLGYDLSAYDAVPYYKNPCINRNWEMLNLAVPNTYTDLVVALKQTEVRFLEEYVKTHFNESAVLEKLEEAKGELHKMAVSAGYVD
jgi:hypothetical protein